jgi:hypothetical protein
MQACGIARGVTIDFVYGESWNGVERELECMKR